jgi:hypothetical protein
MMPPHHPQLTVSPLCPGVSEKSSARAALDARLPMLGEGRCMCGGRGPTDGVLSAEAVDDEIGEAAAAPTGFPQSMQ